MEESVISAWHSYGFKYFRNHLGFEMSGGTSHKEQHWFFRVALTLMTSNALTAKTVLDFKRKEMRFPDKWTGFMCVQTSSLVAPPVNTAKPKTHKVALSLILIRREAVKQHIRHQWIPRKIVLSGLSVVLRKLCSHNFNSCLSLVPKLGT